MFIISTGNEVGLKALDIALQGSTDALLLKQGKRRRVLDVDSTEDPAHGNQENAAYFGANCFHSPVCLHERQRPPKSERQVKVMDFSYQAKSWTRSRRVVCKLE